MCRRSQMFPPSPHTLRIIIVRGGTHGLVRPVSRWSLRNQLAVGLKYTDGFSRIWPTAGTLAAMALSVALLGLTLRWLPLGTAYAVWTGVGMVGTALLGIVLFGESADLFRILCISVIMAGIVGLKLVSTH
jgi:quaternary ammonium compound-resistance protein SugE